MLIQVKVPKDIGLKRKIVEKYTYLYREYRRFYPDNNPATDIIKVSAAGFASLVLIYFFTPPDYKPHSFSPH